MCQLSAQDKIIVLSLKLAKVLLKSGNNMHLNLSFGLRLDTMRLGHNNEILIDGLHRSTIPKIAQQQWAEQSIMDHSATR